MCDYYDGPDDDDYVIPSPQVSLPQQTHKNPVAPPVIPSNKPKSSVNSVPAGYTNPTR